MKTMLITTALALFAAPALAETKSQWGCEWKYGENGNYLTKVDGGCKHWIGLGYATQASMNKDVPPAAEDDSEEPSDPGDDEGPGDEGPGTDPGDNGGGDEGAEGNDRGDRGDRPGRGGRGGKGGKSRN